MPREDLVIQLAELTQRMERLRAALSSKIGGGLPPAERSALRSALAAVAQQIQQPEEELRAPTQRGGAGE